MKRKQSIIFREKYDFICYNKIKKVVINLIEILIITLIDDIDFFSLHVDILLVGLQKVQINVEFSVNDNNLSCLKLMSNK